MIKWVIYAVLGGLSGVQLVVGNIEKVEFTGEIYTIQPKLWRRVNEQLNQLTLWPVMSPPYTFYGEQSIVPADTDSNNVLHEHYTSNIQHNQVTLLRHDSKNMERWYLLSNITQGERYECRISYGATTPTDFVMSLLRYDEVDSLLFTEQSSETESVEPVMETTQLILRVQAIYAGVSNLPNLSKQPVPYNIVLETLVRGIPYQALKLIVAIVVVLITSWWLIVPVIERFIRYCLLSADSVDDKSRSNRRLHDQDGEDKDYDGDNESIQSHDDDDLQMEQIDELIASDMDAE